jgi:hypothetical protein
MGGDVALHSLDARRPRKTTVSRSQTHFTGCGMSMRDTTASRSARGHFPYDWNVFGNDRLGDGRPVFDCRVVACHANAWPNPELLQLLPAERKRAGRRASASTASRIFRDADAHGCIRLSAKPCMTDDVAQQKIASSCNANPSQIAP